MLVSLKHQIQPYLKLETPPPPPRYVSNVSNMSHEFPFLFMAVRVTALSIHSCKSPEYFLHTQTITCTNYSLGFHCKSNWRLTATRMPRKSVVQPVLSSLCSRLRGFTGPLPPEHLHGNWVVLCHSLGNTYKHPLSGGTGCGQGCQHSLPHA